MSFYKAFQEALTYANSDAFKLNKFLQDKRLTQGEKKIIEGYSFLRECKFNEILDLMDEITTNEIWVSAHKNLLTGITYNNKADCYKAISFLKKALEDFTVIQDPIYLFSCHYNLFYTYLNLKMFDQLPIELDNMDQYKHVEEHYPFVIMRSRFNLMISLERYKEATSIMNLLDRSFDQLHQGLKANYLIDKFTFLVATNKLEKANAIISELKKYRAFYLTANYKFMRSLMDYVLEDKRLYLYDKDFQGTPILHQQVKVILYLDQNDQFSAAKAWRVLQQMNPNVYQGNFDYKGNPCLFSLALKKVPHLKEKKFNVVMSKDKEKMIKNLFHDETVIISKEELYMCIWGVEAESKENFSKLAQLIYRTNKRFSLNIKSKKGNFLLANKEKKAA
ncbi:MAG: hypothetical protein ACOYL6_09010 [Bacteriovoracaceae bacterium]